MLNKPSIDFNIDDFSRLVETEIGCEALQYALEETRSKVLRRLIYQKNDSEPQLIPFDRLIRFSQHPVAHRFVEKLISTSLSEDVENFALFLVASPTRMKLGLIANRFGCQVIEAMIQFCDPFIKLLKQSFGSNVNFLINNENANHVFQTMMESDINNAGRDTNYYLELVRNGPLQLRKLQNSTKGIILFLIETPATTVFKEEYEKQFQVYESMTNQGLYDHLEQGWLPQMPQYQ